MNLARPLPAGGKRRQSEFVQLRWIAANVIGEIVGFSLAMMVAYVLALPFEELSTPLQTIGGILEIILIGVIEGVAVGLAQYWVLGRLLPGLSRGEWVGVTVAGAVIAWGAGLALANLFGEALFAALGDSWLLGAMVIGVLAGGTLSAFQWLALRRVARRASVWVPTHAAAWAVGMIVAFAGIRSIPESAGNFAVFGSAALVGFAMGAAVSLITGFSLVWVLRGERGSAAA
jgi:hypothetical protein